MSIQTILLVSVGLLVIFDAVITYTTYTAAQRDMDELADKHRMLNLKFDNSLAGRLRLDERFEDLEKKVREARTELTNVHMKLSKDKVEVVEPANTVHIVMPEHKNGKKNKKNKNK